MRLGRLLTFSRSNLVGANASGPSPKRAIKYRITLKRRLSTTPLRHNMASQPETIIIEGKKYRKVREGLASVLAPYAEETTHTGKQARNNDEGNQAVFYNPIQQFNRDLSVLAILVFGEGAVAEKESRFIAKNRHGRSRKEKRPQKSAEAPTDNKPANESEQINSRKRKAGELAEQSEEGPVKKSKPSEDFDEDDEADLLVEELRSEPVTVQNGQGGKEHTNGQPPCVGEENGHLPPKKKQPAFTILDALSATGLRALRYAKEIPFATNIVANDLLPASVQNIELNIEHNNVKDRVRSNLDDARAFMYSKVGNEHSRRSDGYVHRFDVIDIDPYGTAAPFFDSSLQAVQDGGMLCVTCTDAGVFASTGYPEKTFALYGGMPIKGPHSHEGGLRLILNAIALSAAKYGLAVEPLLSLYIDYYARLFIRIHKRQQDVKFLAGTSMTVYNCGHGCGSWNTQPLLRNLPQLSKSNEIFYKYSFAQAPTTPPNCSHCGSKLHLCGPMWAGPLHNPAFVQKMLDKLPSLDKQTYGTTDRIEGMLTLALEEDLNIHKDKGDEKSASESTVDARVIPRLAPDIVDVSPFFIMPTYLAKTIHCATPSEDAMRGALLGLGYRVSRSHCKPGSIKTNAPWDVLWEVIREFMRTKAPIKDGAVKKGSPGWNILARVRETERAAVTAVKDATKDQLNRCETKDDLKTLLQAMLWRLDNQKQDATTETPKTTSDTSKDDKTTVQQPNDQAQTEKEQTPAAPQKQRSQSPSTEGVSKMNIVFDEKLGKEKPRGRLVRYQLNPRENWGPMNRAGRST